MNATRTIIDAHPGSRTTTVLDKYFYVIENEKFVFRFGDDFIEYLDHAAQNLPPLLFVHNKQSHSLKNYSSALVTIINNYNYFEILTPLIAQKQYKEEQFSLSQTMNIRDGMVT